MKPSKKRTSIRLILSSLVVLSILASFPATLFLFHNLSPKAYQKSFYGEFLPMFRRLGKAEGKKIVVIGTSSVAFGLDETVLEDELAHAGLDYRVIGYGLYGALGTKLMMETALPQLKSGDIVLLSPEQNAQTLSSYFSPLETYRAIESDTTIFPCLESSQRKDMLFSLPLFVKEKVSLLANGGAKGEGIYSSSSFDEQGRLKKGLRLKNEMDGYWQKQAIPLNFSLYQESFLIYINEFCRKAEQIGVKVYYSFCPMNELALPIDADKQLDSLYDSLNKALVCPLLGNPMESVFEPNYFFDSDFHLNDAGAILHSLRLASMIKTEFDSAVPNAMEDPLPPELPKREEQEVFGIDDDASCFLYENDGENGLALIGVSEDGKKKRSLILPTHANGKPVVTLSPYALSNAGEAESVLIQKNITYLPDSLMEGNSTIKEIHLEEDRPDRIRVGWGLLKGAEQVRIYVFPHALQEFRIDYFWQHYAPYLEGERM